LELGETPGRQERRVLAKKKRLGWLKVSPSPPAAFKDRYHILLKAQTPLFPRGQMLASQVRWLMPL
jgi:hypothetical protein